MVQRHRCAPGRVCCSEGRVAALVQWDGQVMSSPSLRRMEARPDEGEGCRGKVAR